MNKQRVLDNLRIKPLVSGFCIRKVDPFKDSYIWDPKLAYPCLNKIKIATIEAKSYYSFYGLFKPSVAEVIDSIPDDLLPEVDWFQISKEPMPVGMETTDGTKVEIRDKENCHVFKVDLFKKKWGR